MKRREFLVYGVSGAAAAIMINACGGDDSSSESPSTENNAADQCAEGASGSIASNHGHTLIVSASDVEAGTAKTYDIRGSSNHSHSVSLDAADFQALQNGDSVSKISTTGAGHTHSVSVQCA